MSKLKKILFICVNALMIVLLIVISVMCVQTTKLLDSQQAATRWRGDNEDRFAQISCFMPLGSEIQEQDIHSFRESLGSMLVENSLKPPEGGSLWTDAYSAFGEISLSSQRDTATINAIGVGGNFFFFHPLKLLYGSYIYPDDLMRDQVVIDDLTAWRLFGSSDVVGQELIINGTTHIVAGVVELESDKFSDRILNGEPVVFVSYETLIGSVDTGISCYETVLPNPISGFALDFVSRAFPLGGGDAIENSSRYSFSRIFRLITDFGDRSVQTTGVGYPYWENAARVTEDYLALYYIIAIVFSVFPLLIVLIILIVKLIRRLLSKKQAAKNFLLGIPEKYRARRLAGKAKQRVLPREATGEPAPRTSRKKAPPTKKAARRTPPDKPKSPKPDREEDDEIRLDIESIVREVMEED